jgi:hypothetical protein
MKLAKIILAGILVGITLAFSAAGVLLMFQMEPEVTTNFIFVQLICAQLLVLFKINKV